jgi:hypothetical protein
LRESNGKTHHYVAVAINSSLYFTLFEEVKQKVARIAIFSRNGGNFTNVTRGYWQLRCDFFFRLMARNQSLQGFYRGFSPE